MSDARPSKEERAAWTELLGEERVRRPAPLRRWVSRLVAVGGLLVVIAVPYALARNAGYVGCPSAADATAFFAKSADQVSDDDRDVEIRRVLRCVDFKGMTRNQVQAELGAWTPVALYPAYGDKRNGQGLVWSNDDTSGVGVWFTGPRGHAFLAERYDP